MINKCLPRFPSFFKAFKGEPRIPTSPMRRNYLKLEKLCKGISPEKELPLELIRLSVRIRKLDEEKQIATGEVYAPFVIDSHGDMMEPEDVELIAHRFLANTLNDRIDIMHNNRPANAVAVESFISKGSEDFNEGAWVLSVKVNDDDVWEDIRVGKLSGYSLEAMVKKVPALVELEIQNHVFGVVEENDGHDHAFFVKVNDDGRVEGGQTSEDEDHDHAIGAGGSTETAEKHRHRYFLP